MEIQDEYKRVEKIFNDIESNLLSDIGKSAFAKSLRVIFYKIKCIEQIKDAILNSKEIYTSQILHRSLIEHYFVVYYIFLRNKIDNSDQVGEEYYSAYSNSETIKQVMYIVDLDNIKDGGTNKTDINLLKQKHPQFSELSQNDLDECHRIANQFSNVKKIGRFLIENKGHEPNLDELNEKTFDLLDRYNLLSSYVHGGPFAEKMTFEPEKAIKDINNKSDIESWASELSHFVKLILFSAVEREFHEKHS